MLALLPAEPFVGRDVVGALRMGGQPLFDGGLQLGVVAQAAREPDLGEPDLMALEQVAQRAQALELPGP